MAVEAETLLEEAREVARPKAVVRLAAVEEKGEDWVVIEGVRLESRVLRVNLDQAHRVFAYVATCGMELQRWGEGLTDMLHSYWADEIKAMALGAATRALNAYLVECYRPGRTATMAPGSLSDWPIQQQNPLFRLLGDPRAAIGVELTDSYLMVPNKSVSGLRFPTEEPFDSCLLCPRDACPGRRAPYDPELYDRKYRQAESVD
jgi:cobalamin-dependent methionine synthase I